jgi:hypothetical protein
MIALSPTPFERRATDNQYDIAAAVLSGSIRVYADRSTQAAFDAYNEGARGVARMLTESAEETDALRQRIRQLAGSE